MCFVSRFFTKSNDKADLKVVFKRKYYIIFLNRAVEGTGNKDRNKSVPNRLKEVPN